MSDWNEVRDALAKQLWKEGETSSQVAARINAEHGTTFTRNAVIGRLHRLGVTGSDKPQKPHVPKKRSAGARPRTQHRARTLRLPVPRLVVRHEPILASRPLPFLKARSGRCKWPMWSDYGIVPLDDKMVCGADTDGVYCEFHHQLGYSEGTPSERAADKLSEAA